MKTAGWARAGCAPAVGRAVAPGRAIRALALWRLPVEWIAGQEVASRWLDGRALGKGGRRNARRRGPCASGRSRFLLWAALLLLPVLA